MGLAVLPARLKNELELLASALVEGSPIHGDETLDKHGDWADELKEKYGSFSKDTVEEILQEEVGLVFEKVLEDAGVYKNTPEGREAFLRFVEYVG